jgi:ectoine hydroxylase-related dioxygenase (phytanoyl-CoA dioxygenase family)
MEPVASVRDSGYAIHAGILSANECDTLARELSRDSIPRTRAGARHLMNAPAIRSLACDTRLVGIARAILCSSAVPFRATLFAKSPDTNWLIPWHQDTALPLACRFETAGWGPWSEKSGVAYAHAPAWALSRVVALRIHLDDSEPGNGPLRVIPQSQDRGVLTDEQIRACVNAQSSVECLTPRGGIVSMRPLIIHASSKALTGEPRRVLHIEYADSLDLAHGIRLAVA